MSINLSVRLEKLRWPVMIVKLRKSQKKEFKNNEINCKIRQSPAKIQNIEISKFI